MVLHVDLNSFFARVEQQANPKLRSRPIGVLGKGHKGARTCVCAASPEAKKPFGVKSGMSVAEAREKCPGILLIPPDYPKYLDISRRFMTILERFTPWVEIFSIDEAFLKLNSKVRSQRSEMQINPPVGGQNEENEIQMAIDTTLAIKQAMRSELGELITCSIGIAWGRIFAKLAGELKKPDGLVVLRPDTWLERVGSLPVTEICGIGDQLGNRLARLGINSIYDLSQADAGLMTGAFGRSLGMYLYYLGRGQDLSPIKSNTHLGKPKSIGHQLTLDTNQSIQHILPIILELARKVGRRLRRSNQAAHQLTLYLSLKSHQVLKPSSTFGNPLFYEPDLLHTSHRLYSSLNYPRASVSRIGLVATKLITNPNQQISLFPQTSHNRLITQTLDSLRDRYGEPIIGWASSFGVDVGNLRDWRGANAVLDQ